jgi:hypothetical protein
LLQGKWNIQSFILKEIKNGNPFQTTLIKPVDSTMGHFICVDGKLVRKVASVPGDFYRVERHTLTNEATYNFNSNNLFVARFDIVQKQLNIEKSTCTDLIYDFSSTNTTGNGHYYYSADSKKLLIIYEQAGAGRNETGVEQYTVQTITADSLQLVRPTTTGISETITLTK